MGNSDSMQTFRKEYEITQQHTNTPSVRQRQTLTPFDCRKHIVSDEDCDILFRKMQSRLQNSASYIYPIQHRFQMNQMCSFQNAYFLVTPKPKSTLQIQLQTRRRMKIPFTEGEMMQVVQTITKALNQLNKNEQCHRNVNFDAIYITKQNQILLKDPLMDCLPTSTIQSALRCSYPSPQRLLSYFDVMTDYDSYCADLYSTGMMVLQMYYCEVTITSQIYNLDYIKYPTYENVQIKENRVQQLIQGIKYPQVKKAVAILLSRAAAPRKDIEKINLHIRLQDVRWITINDQQQQQQQRPFHLLTQMRQKPPPLPTLLEEQKIKIIPPTAPISRNFHKRQGIQLSKPVQKGVEPKFHFVQNNQSYKNNNLMPIESRVILHQVPNIQNNVIMPLQIITTMKSPQVKEYRKQLKNQMFIINQKPEPQTHDPYIRKQFKKQTHIQQNKQYQYKPNQKPFLTINNPFYANVVQPSTQIRFYKPQQHNQFRAQPQFRTKNHSLNQSQNYDAVRIMSKSKQQKKTLNFQATNGLKQANHFTKIEEVNKKNIKKSEQFDNSYQISRKMNLVVNNPSFNKSNGNIIQHHQKIKKAQIINVQNNNRDKLQLYNQRDQPQINTSQDTTPAHRLIELQKAQKNSTQFQRILKQIRMKIEQINKIPLSEQYRQSEPYYKAISRKTNSSLPVQVANPSVANPSANNLFAQSSENEVFVVSPQSANSNIHNQSASNTNLSVASPTTRVQQKVKTSSQSFSKVDDIYVGETRNGKRHGQGRLTYAKGGYYEGQWSDQVMSGYGQLFYPDNTLAYAGQWKDGMFHGHGRIYNDRPTPVQGEFDYKDFNTLDDEWVSYEGQIQQDLKEGYGIMKFSNGDCFKGNFKGDKADGEGVFIKSDGSCVRGVWAQSMLHQP